MRNIQQLLEALQKGRLSVAEAEKALPQLFLDKSYAKARVDRQRFFRHNIPETIYGEGKSHQEIRDIATSLMDAGQNILITRSTQECFDFIKNLNSNFVFHKRAGCIKLIQTDIMQIGTCAIISAGTADAKVVEECRVTAEICGIKAKTYYDMGVAGLHRLLDIKEELEQYPLLIVVAGMDGALFSVVAGLLPQPIIAVPTSIGYGAAFAGVSPLLSALNACSSGVCVMNIDNGFGAARAAHRILQAQKNNIKFN